MLQLDLLVAFAIGCSLATSAGDGLKETNFKTRNKYFVFMLLHMSLVFVPVNIYMLWENTGYKTMFYYDASMHGMWPALYAYSMVLTGIIGFMLGRKFIRMEKELTAYSAWIVISSAWVTIVSSHCDRVLYPGGIRDWYNGKKYTLIEFISSEVAMISGLGSLVIIIPVFYAQMYWPREEGYLTKARKSTIKWHCTKMFFNSSLAAALIYSTCKVARLTPEGWGWDRLGALLLAQLLFAVILLLPVFLMSTKYVITKKIDIRRIKQAPLPRKRKQRLGNNYTIGTIEQSDTVDDSSVDNSESGSVQLENNSNGHVPLDIKED